MGAVPFTPLQILYSIHNKATRVIKDSILLWKLTPLIHCRSVVDLSLFCRYFYALFRSISSGEPRMTNPKLVPSAPVHLLYEFKYPGWIISHVLSNPVITCFTNFTKSNNTYYLSKFVTKMKIINCIIVFIFIYLKNFHINEYYTKKLWKYFFNNITNIRHSYIINMSNI